jgi:Protein of unknown function (DUF2946)
MFTRLRRRGWSHWTTLVVLVLAALAPAVSHALAAARGDLAPWSVICSARSGAPMGWPADAQGDQAPDLKHLFEHCPYCATQHGDGGAPTAESAPVLLSLAQAEPPALFLHAPRTLAAWSVAQPRAPPQAS